MSYLNRTSIAGGFVIKYQAGQKETFGEEVYPENVNGTATVSYLAHLPQRPKDTPKRQEKDTI